MAVTVSTSLDGDIADRVKALALSEHRTVSNLVAAAVSVFTDLPKGVRDALLEVRGGVDPHELRKLTRAMEAVVARRRFDKAAAALAAEGHYDPAIAAMSEIERLEAASEVSASPRR